MTRIDRTIEVNVPVTTAYNQWTQFEEFPRFMEGVEEVYQLDETRLHWKAKIGGQRREWEAQIIRQVPDEMLSWRSESEDGPSGTIIFKPIDDRRTELEVHMEYETEGVKEKVGDALGVISRRVDGDLARFREFIEQRGMETGAWRGEVMHGEERPVAPLQDSSNAPDPDQVRFGESAKDGFDHLNRP